MKINAVKPGVKAQKSSQIEEKATISPEALEDIRAIYGMDEMDADMQRKLRVLRKADPELYRKITNLD